MQKGTRAGTLTAVALLMSGAALCACGRNEAPSHGGGIGYEIDWGSQSALLGNPSGQLPDEPVAIRLRVGEKATINGVNKATPAFDERYSLSAGVGKFVSVQGSTIRADRIGDSNVWLASKVGDASTACPAGASRCRIVLIHVVT